MVVPPLTVSLRLGTIGFAWVARRLLPVSRGHASRLRGSPFDRYAGMQQYAGRALAVAMPASVTSGESGLRRLAVLSAVGAAAILFSHPVAFVLGGIGTALFLDALVAKYRRRVGAFLATIACWLASFGVSYVLCLKQLGNNQFLLDYWDGHFLPLPPTSQGDLMWLADHFFGFLAYPGGLGGTEIKSGGIAAALCVIGLLAMARDRWPVAVAIVLPALFALAASGVHKYPFAGRMLLFLVPLMLLAVARGAWSLAAALRPSQPFAAFVLIGVLMSATAVESYQSIRRPPRHEQITPVLATVRSEWQPGDKVYIYYGAIPAFTYYTRDNPFPPGVILGNEHRGERTGYRDELATLAGEPRVWLIFSHPHLSEEPMIRGYAEGLGDCVKEVRGPGAAAYLFDFRRAKWSRCGLGVAPPASRRSTRPA